MIELLLFGVSLLIIISILTSKLSYRLGVPALLFFLFIGIMAGSEGIGGIEFDNPWLAQFAGITALIYILFSGGLETSWKFVRSCLWKSTALATAGVLFTAVLVGLFSVYILNFSFLEGMLLGAIVSSTDAAAVFSILRSKKISLQGKLKPLLELESGSNDPMAVFLTVSIITLILNPSKSIWLLIPSFITQMAVGGLIGFAFGKAAVLLINYLKLEYDGLYPVLTMGMVALLYASVSMLGGSGFLAVYVAGIVLGNSIFFNKKIVVHFHGGLAWLMQIVMFVSLGILVFPSEVAAVAGKGVLIAVFLMAVARPIAVFLSTAPFNIPLNSRLFISWVGLRGSAPIMLATFPLLAGVSEAHFIFNIVFFIVVLSVLLQGTTIPFFSKLLKVDAPHEEKSRLPLEFDPDIQSDKSLQDFTLGFDSYYVGKTVSELGLPDDSLIALIVRNEEFVVPGGKVILEAGDVLLVMVNEDNLARVKEILTKRADG